jgi:hypothetical protein
VPRGLKILVSAVQFRPWAPFLPSRKSRETNCLAMGVALAADIHHLALIGQEWLR